MLFLSGDHVLDINVRVANISRLTMQGWFSSDSIATVVRNGSVGFSFTNIVDFNICSLAFTSYNKSLDPGSHPASNSTLFLQSILHAKLVNCSFHNNIGTALAVHHTNISLAVKNEFNNNYCACESFTDLCRIGCGITALNSTLTFTGSTAFSGNKRNSSGQGHFEGAGAIFAVTSSLSFNGTNKFCDNHDGGGSSVGVGGAIYTTKNTVFTVHGTSSFFNNWADRYGGAIYASYNTVLSFIGTTKFSGNSAKYGGGAIYAEVRTSLAFTGTSEFMDNSAEFSGGAISIAINSVLTFNGTNYFIKNSAERSGGAIAIFVNVALTFNGTNKFISNSANSDGGAIYAVTYSSLKFIGITDFSNNSAKGASGGAIYAKITVSLTFIGTNDFSNNTAKFSGGAVYTYDNAMITFSNSNSFTNNSANGNGGAIYAASNISLSFAGTSSFSNNLALQGGAIYMSIRTTFSILPHTTVCWEHNRASLGGAIYVYDVNPLVYCTPIARFISKEECFFQVPSQKYANSINVQLVFINNSADDAGSVLYGGTIDNCKLSGLESNKSGKVFDILFHNKDTDYKTTSSISSDPFLICPCKHDHPDCDSSIVPVHYPSVVYPGETFQISVVAAGQRDGTVSTTVRTTASTSDIDFHTINPNQYLQQTNNICTKLNYTLFSLSPEVNIQLYPEDSPCSNSYGQILNISVNLNQTCPPGFNISESVSSCVCEPRLAQYTNQCTITNGVGRITRDSNQHFWVGYDPSLHTLILHPDCPFDYCVNDKKVFPLNNTDLQCAFNRSGLLCGRCQKGYSVVLGTSHCKKCTNIYLLLLVAFAVMGVALVLFLFVCKLTVATGTLSGLVFYANIVGVNSTIFLPGESIATFSAFITWVNYKKLHGCL